MKYRKMGSLDWEVAALGFGCMRLPTRRKSMLSRVNEKEAIRIIRHAIDLGVNYFDNGYPYHLGAGEKILGKALQEGYREKVHVTTKLPMFLVKKTEDFEKYLNRQLEKLQTDYLDFYFFHGLNRGRFEKVKELGLITKMEEAKENGLINHIGFSFHDTLSVFKKIIDYYNWDAVQIQYNYMDTEIQATTEGLKYAHEKGLAVIVMEPLRGGQLVNPSPEALEVMNKARTKRTPVDWALQFLWNLPEVSVVLSGMSSQQMIDENCHSAEQSGINSLSKDDMKIIKELAEIYRKSILVPCTTCEYCMPCPSGVNIPDNFAMLNNYSHEEGIRRWLARRKYKLLAKSENDVNKKHPNGNASICTKCGECLEKCPQQINIPDELEKVHAILGKRKNISNFFSKKH